MQTGDVRKQATLHSFFVTGAPAGLQLAPPMVTTFGKTDPQLHSSLNPCTVLTFELSLGVSEKI
jgi:hypothetical protein